MEKSSGFIALPVLILLNGRGVKPAWRQPAWRRLAGGMPNAPPFAAGSVPWRWQNPAHSRRQKQCAFANFPGDSRRAFVWRTGATWSFLSLLAISFPCGSSNLNR